MGRMPPKLREKRADSPQPSGQSRTVEAAEDPTSPRADVNSGGLETIDLSELMQTYDSDTSKKRSPSPKKKKGHVSSDDEDDDDPTPPSPKPKSKTLLQVRSTSKPPTASTSQAKSSSVPKAKVPSFKPKVLLPRKFKPASSLSQFKAKISKNKEKPTSSKRSIPKPYDDTLEDPEDGTEDEAEDEEILVSERKKMQEDGRNIFALMTPEDTQEFLTRIQRQCSPLDNATYMSRERHIKWYNVAFGAYGEYQCKCVWAFFRTHTRRHRILYELVNEVKLKLTDSVAFQFKLIESIPGFPQKPPSISHAFHIYNREKWNEIKESVQDPKDLPNFIKFQQQCKEEYNCLSRDTKKKYEERAALAQAEYERQVKAFYAENPGVAKLVERLHGDEAIRKEKLKKKKAEVKAEKRRTDREIKRKEAKLNPAPMKEKVKVLKLPNPYADAPQPPQTAVVLFIQAKLNRIDPPPSSEDIPIYKTRFLNKWKKLSGPKKVKWIDYCISLCEEFLLELEKYRETHPGFTLSKGLKVKQLLTRDELALWETEHGKPVPPKGTVFDLFMEELVKSDTTLTEMSESERDSLARNKWSELDWYHKEMYRMKYKISIVEYKKQIQNFFSGLPEFMKEWCMERIPKRFQKICNEVDTVPQDETLLPSEQLKDSSETQPPPPKKKKKDSKSKSDNVIKHQSSTEEIAQKPTSSNYQEDQSLPVSKNSIADSDPQQHVFEEPKPSPKKRKRKARDPNLITGDIFSDSQSESQTDGEGEQRRSKRGLKAALLNSSTPIYQQDVTEDIRKELNLLRYKPGSKGVDEQFSDAVKHQVDLMQEADEKTVHHITEAFVKKNKRIKYPPTTKVTQKDIFNAIRGIFDARAHLGYDYSVYYYYAKHVGGDRFWIDCVNNKGLEKAALKLIKSFLALNDHQKEVFTGDSARWHMSLKHQAVEAGRNLYPGEPRPPPSSVAIYYTEERRKLKKRFPDIEYPEFVNLDPVTQNYYLKKLYHETKLYMRRYDMFIQSMTPNDLVGFAVFKARNWEKELYRRSTIIRAIDEYIFPFCRKESKLNLDNEISQPTEAAKKNKSSKKRIVRKKREKNPFADDFDIVKIAKKLPPKRKNQKLWRKSINPLDMQLAECQRIIKRYADMNIVIKSKKRNKKDLVGGRVEKRREDKRRLRHMQWKCRMLEKKAQILATLREAESTQTPEGNPDAMATGTGDPLSAANEVVEIHLNDDEGSSQNAEQAGQQNPQNLVVNDGEGSGQNAEHAGEQNLQNLVVNDAEGSGQNTEQPEQQNPPNPVVTDGEGSGQNAEQPEQQNPPNPVVTDGEGSGQNAEQPGQQNPHNPVVTDGEGSGQNAEQPGQQNPHNPVVTDGEGSGQNAEQPGQQNPVAQGNEVSKRVSKPELRNAMGRFQPGTDLRTCRLRVSKKRRGVNHLQRLKPYRKETSNSRILEDAGGGDDLSDTEVTFRLYPRVKPILKIISKEDFKLVKPKNTISAYRFGISKSIDNWKKRRELILHRAKKYFYPVDDIIKSEGIKQPTVTFRYNSSTQTEYLDVSVNQFTQTTSKCVKSRGTVTEVRGVRKQPRKRPTDVIIY